MFIPPNIFLLIFHSIFLLRTDAAVSIFQEVHATPTRYLFRILRKINKKKKLNNLGILFKGTFWVDEANEGNHLALPERTTAHAAHAVGN